MATRFFISFKRFIIYLASCMPKPMIYLHSTKTHIPYCALLWTAFPRIKFMTMTTTTTTVLMTGGEEVMVSMSIFETNSMCIISKHGSSVRYVSIFHMWRLSPSLKCQQEQDTSPEPRNPYWSSSFLTSWVIFNKSISLFRPLLLQRYVGAWGGGITNSQGCCLNIKNWFMFETKTQGYEIP